MPIERLEAGKVVPVPYRFRYQNCLVMGDPLTGKTTGFLTVPGPRELVVVPGEEGYSSILESAETKVHSLEIASGVHDYQAEWNWLRLKTREVLARGKDVKAIGLDGLHKAYDLVFGVLDYPHNESLWGEKAYGKGYARAEQMFMEWVLPVLASPITYKYVTCYSGKVAQEPGSTKQTLFPELPGKMARRILGSFPVIFNAEKQGVGASERFLWRLKSTTEVMGVGTHFPKEVKALLPEVMEQDFAKFEALVESALTKLKLKGD